MLARRDGAAAVESCLKPDQLKSFLEDLQAQLGLYHDISGLNKRQMALLEAPENADPDELLTLVGQKQNIMSELGVLEERVRPMRDLWHDARPSLPDTVRDFADKLLAELSQTIKQVLEMEDAAHARLQTIMAQTQAGIDSIRKKSQVNRAYAAYNKSPAQPKYVDKRTDEQ